MYGNNNQPRETLEQARERNIREAQEREDSQQAHRAAVLANEERLIAKGKAERAAAEKVKAEELQTRVNAAQQAEATRLKQDARQHYIGTAAEFEADWPAIRAHMQAERIAKQAAQDSARFRRDF